MYVYFKDGSKRRWIADVHLKDGFCPCIGDSTYNNNLRMEPAIWFKVLVLESISLDCGKRVVSWSTKSDDDEDSCTRNSFYGGGECYDYDDDTDELFKLAQGLMDGTSENTDNSKTNDEHDLLRMLHCYILPKIPLHIEDLEKVNQAMEKQVQDIVALDNQVVQQCKTIDECKARLEDVRTHLLPDLEDIIQKYQCPKGFLGILMEDVKKEEWKLRREVSTAQDCVQIAKEIRGKNPCSETEDRLAKARLQRDEIQGKLESLLNCREVIVSAQTVVHHVGGAAVGYALLHNYLQLREELEREKECRNRLLEQKNCALSVREMLECTIGELKEKGFTEANEANAQGLRPSDVLQGGWHPEWQKLGERVATIVNNKEHPIGNYFLNFCDELQRTCQQLITCGKQADLSADVAVLCMPFGHSPGNGRQNSYELLGLDDFMVSAHREKLHNIKDQISNHLDKATGLLTELFNNHERTFQNKLRLCYEQCFYDKVHTFIECVYELAHHRHVGTLEQDVHRLKKLPIKLLDLQVKDEWWLELFDQREHLGNLSTQTLRPIPQSVVDGFEEGLGESYDMINDFIETWDESDGEMEDGHLEKITDVNQVRSLCINVIRKRSKTFNDEQDEESASVNTNAVPMPHPQTFSCSALSTSAPALPTQLTLADIMTHWEEKQGERKEDSLRRRLSRSQDTLTRNSNKGSKINGENHLCRGDTFADHFGPSLQNIRDIFKASSPLAKLKCLTSSLRKITEAVQELRKRDGADEFSAAVTAEDLLPLLVLMMLQMEPWEVAVMWPQLSFMEDLMASFLASGCHGWALVEFQMAQRFLHTLCEEF